MLFYTFTQSGLQLQPTLCCNYSGNSRVWPTTPDCVYRLSVKDALTQSSRRRRSRGRQIYLCYREQRPTPGEKMRQSRCWGAFHGSPHPAHLGGLEQVLRNWETPTCVCPRPRCSSCLEHLFPESPGNSRTWWVNMLFRYSALSGHVCRLDRDGDTERPCPVLLTVMTCIKLIKCTYHNT